MKVKLGDRYRDSISGFEGVATSRVEHLHRCPTVWLERADDEAKPCEQGFDEPRLQPITERSTGFQR